MSQITNYQRLKSAQSFATSKYIHSLVLCSGSISSGTGPAASSGFFSRVCQTTNIRCDSDLHRNVTLRSAASKSSLGVRGLMQRHQRTPRRRESGTLSPPMPSHVRRTRTVSCRVKAAKLLSATFGARLAQFGHWRGRGADCTVRLTAHRGTIMHRQSRIRRDSFQTP